MTSRKRVLWTLLGIGALLCAVALAAGLFASWLLIDWTDSGADDYAGGTVLRDAAGRVMRVSLGPGDTDCRPYYMADPSDWIVKAIVASEDGTFWTHRGVRPFSALRAAFQNLATRRRVSGASTITMQAVRLIAPHPKSLFQKYCEAIRALKMERKRGKLWILSQYLNRAPFGSNLVGIEAAANGWFGKGAKELGLGEAACLAGMVQAPSRFRPDRSIDAALRRRAYVLERMRALGYITEEQRQAAETVRPVVCRAPRPFRHPFFCDWAMAQACGGGAPSRLGGDRVTTLDADVQGLCDRAVAEAARAGGYSSAVVVMRVLDGAVLALACSGDYFDRDGGQVNTALAPRPAGSTLKTMLTALAFDRGLATPEERLRDEPCSYAGYRPANFDAHHRGRVTVQDALVLSLNIPFVQLLSRVGVSEFGTTLRALGFRHLTAGDETFGLGMAIGNVEVSLLELVAASAALARGGVYLPPKAFADANGKGVRVFSEGASFLVSDILSGTARSHAALGHVADVETARFAWKTGTSAAHRDAWTVAWNPEYAVGVWCGHKSGGFGDTRLVGAKASAPVCWQIARSLYPRNDAPWFPEPEDVARRKICASTGLPATAECRKTETGRALRGRTPFLPCGGAAAHAAAADAAKLAIVRPADGATIRCVPGMGQQRLICEAVGGTKPGRLWWLLDGIPVGESAVGAPFAVELSVGGHTITCTTAEGVAASVGITVALDGM